MTSTPVFITGFILLTAMPAIAQTPEYHTKLTVGEYQTGSTPSVDVNARYSHGDWTGWLGFYGSGDIDEGRVGIEYDWRTHWLYLVPSAQAASKGFLGGTIYSEIGDRVYAIAGLSHTNLEPYVNLTFDPNESWQLGLGAHLNKTDSIGLFTIWDNRLDTGQQVTHAFLRHYFTETHRRITVDASYKSGHGDDGIYVRGGAATGEYDWSRYFVKLAADQHANFGSETMYRLGGGVRF